MVRPFLSLITALSILTLAGCATGGERQSTALPARPTVTTALATATPAGRPTPLVTVTATVPSRPIPSGPSPTATRAGSLSWRLVTSTIKSARDIAISPRDPNVVYAVGNGIYRSDDGGKAWKQLRADIDARDIVLGGEGKIIVVASGTNCARGGPAPVYRSTDEGASWAPIQTEALGGLVVDPMNPSRFYAATCGGFVRSDDGGVSWNRLPNPVPGYDGSAIAVSPDSRVIVGALVSEGGTVRLIRSSDAGASFSPLASPELWGSASVAVGQGGRIDVVTSKHAITTRDGGKTWTIIDAGLDRLVKNGDYPYFDVGVMRANPVTSSILYLATSAGLYRHVSDSGEWQSFGAGLAERITSFDVTVAGGATIFYAATAEGIYRLDVSS